MVKLRLQRYGKKRSPHYRIVAADSKTPRDGRFIEIVGLYQPTNKNEEIRLDEEKILKWLSLGAQPTDTVKSIFKKQGLNAKFQESKKQKKA